MLSSGLLLNLVLELVGCAAVPVPLYAQGATPFLRVAKPLASFGLCFGAGRAFGAPAGLAYVALQAVAGFALHRRWCAARGKPRWLGTTSPYLFRNPGQAKLWAAVCP
jgi:hypothetical protein